MRHKNDILLLFAAIMCGCMSPHQSTGTATSPISWDRGNSAVLYFENTDTAAIRDMSILLRHDAKQASVPVNLVISISSPSGIQHCDTVMAYLNGKYTSNDIQETVCKVFSGITFSEYGRYRFEVSPLSELRGVWGVGLDFSIKK